MVVKWYCYLRLGFGFGLWYQEYDCEVSALTLVIGPIAITRFKANA